MSTQSKTPGKTPVKVTAKGVQHIQNWDEKPYKEFAGGKKLTKATVTATFSASPSGMAMTPLMASFAALGVTRSERVRPWGPAR